MNVGSRVSLGDSLALEVVDTRHPKWVSSRLEVEQRRSFLLRYQGPSGLTLGEASPLPGYGDDDPFLAEQDLLTLCARHFARAVDETRSAFLEGESPLLVASDLCSGFSSRSARFCVEMALLDAVSREIHVPVCRLLAPHPHSTLGTSVVLDPLSPEVEAALQRAISRGVRAFKIKIGRELSRELIILRRLHGLAGSSVVFRLDANRALSDTALAALAETISDCAVEWVEDPTEHPERWSKLFRSKVTLLAIDEFLVGRVPSEEFLMRSGAGVVVLKPMALGGFAVCVGWARCARALGLDVVVSHLFDGPVALDAAAHLALGFATKSRSQGLGLHAGLSGFLDQGWAAPTCVTETTVSLDLSTP